MESVLSAVIVVFVILFAAFTLSSTVFINQNELHEAWLSMEQRIDEYNRTHLSSTSAQVTGNGTVVEVRFLNDGTTRLANFRDWDVYVEYTDGTWHHIDWFPYSTSPVGPSWTVAGIYYDGQPEQFEPEVLNPHESLLLRITLSPPVQAGTTVYVSIATAQGVTSSNFAYRNVPPALATNTGATLLAGSSVVINSNQLATSDPDHPATDLRYTITSSPSQGQLSIPYTFTQADINTGLLSYTHTGLGNDSFQFSVSDGVDTTGTYSFDINIQN